MSYPGDVEADLPHTLPVFAFGQPNDPVAERDAALLDLEKALKALERVRDVAVGAYSRSLAMSMGDCAVYAQDALVALTKVANAALESGAVHPDQISLDGV